MIRIILILTIAVLISLMAPPARSDFVSPIFLPVIYKPPQPDPFDKCIAATYANPTDLNKLNLDCFYTWGPTRPAWADQADAEWIPMVRDVDDAEDILAGNRTLDHNGTVMLFNECDAPIGSGQCEASPQQAADLTHQLQAVFPDVHTWVAPAVHNLGTPGWFSAYWQSCHGCQLDIIAIHWYDVHNCTLGEYTAYVDSFKPYARPIWITEIACLDPAQNGALMPQYWLHAKGDPSVTAFFPWALKIGPLYGDLFWVDYVDIYTGELTELGQWYALIE